MIDGMSNQLEQLMAHIEMLEHVLSPIRTVGPDSANAMPQEAPANKMHEFILRLEHANMRLHILNGELHL
jgi:hypothetical protein